METIFTLEELERIHRICRDGQAWLTVDVHGMTANAAMKFIRNIVALHHRDDIHLTVIHGYHHGTAIKDALHVQHVSWRKVMCKEDIWNPGVTLVEVA